MGALDVLIGASVVDMKSKAIDFWETIFTLRRAINQVRNAWTHFQKTDDADDVDRVRLVIEVLYMMSIHGVFPDNQYDTKVLVYLGNKDGPEVVEKLKNAANDLTDEQKSSIHE